MPSLTAFAEEILANAKILDKYLASAKQPSPSPDHDSLESLPSDLEATRNALVDSTHSLNRLSQGAVRSTVGIIFNWTDLLSLRVIHTYKLPHAVPLDGSATYEEIASKSGIAESIARRFMRHAMANFIFAEASSDSVRHTAASRLMVTDAGFFDAIGLETAELAPTAGRFIDTLDKYGDSGEPSKSAFSIANNIDAGTYKILARYPERARQFGAGMRFFTKDEGWNLKHLIRGFDWPSIDRPETTVVDMGGGQGGVSQALAQATTHIKFIVQDLPGTAEQGRAALPAEYHGRIEFMGHDFFSEQPLPRSPSRVFLFRWIFHNWSDDYAVKILRNLIPALVDGTRILIYEYVLSDEPDTRLSEKMGLNCDMVMAACFSALERTRTQWVRLLEKADERFDIRNIVRPEGSTMSIIEISWKPT